MHGIIFWGVTICNKPFALKYITRKFSLHMEFRKEDSSLLLNKYLALILRNLRGLFLPRFWSINLLKILFI